MHELSIALSIIDLAREEAERMGVRVQAVHLRVGPLSGVVPRTLLSSYELAAAETPLEGSRLVIEETPLRVFCESCRKGQELESIQRFTCPICGLPTPEVLQGNELEVFALEVFE